MSARILHADLDAFYASVEQRDDARLRGRPVIVGGGVVLAASYEAKAYGVRTAMGGGQARALCPHAVVVPPRFAAYTAASRAVFDVFGDTTPVVEGLSIDEAFLDVGGLRRLVGGPLEIAARLRARVRAEVGLPITVGVARTKFLAKVASRVAKPDGLLLVPPEREREFLHPLAVELLWGVGPATSARLRERGIRTVADVARQPEAALIRALGPAAGHRLHALARGFDPRPVLAGRRRASMGAQRALSRGRWSAPELDAVLLGLVERVTRRMRAAARVGRTVTLRLRFADYAEATRSRTLAVPTSATAEVLAAARVLLAKCAPLVGRRGLTLLGVAVGNLTGAEHTQLALPFGEPPSLDAAVDRVRDRFGSSAVSRGVLLGRGQGWEMPLLPD